MAVRGGRIAALGASAGEVRRAAPAGSEVLAFPDGFVRPGFWDTHLHIARTGAAALRGPLLYEARSVAEIVERLAEFAGRHPELPAVVARAGCLDGRVLAEGRLPETADLDRAESRRPVVIADVNKTIANGAALAAAGLAPGGGPLRFEAGRALHDRFVPRGLPGAYAESFAAGTRLLASRGVTCAVDGGARVAAIEDVRRLDAEGRLGCRAILAPATSWDGDLEDFQASRHEFGEELGPLSRVGPAKLFYDLFVMHRSAAMYRPYPGEPGNRGRYKVEPEGLRLRLGLARERGFPVAVHVTGDRGAAEAAALIEEEGFGAPGPLFGRSFLIHAYFPPPGLVEKVRDLGLGVAAQPVFLRHWAEGLEDLLGPERAADFNPLDEYLAAGVAVAAGSDAPICDPEPLAGVHAMVARRSLSGRVWGARHALSRAQALDLYSGSAARLFAWSGFPGGLEVGAPADLTVLDRDLETCADDEIPGARVLATYVAGRETYRAKP
mgnify:CR=1 FL=1